MAHLRQAPLAFVLLGLLVASIYIFIQSSSSSSSTPAGSSSSSSSFFLSRPSSAYRARQDRKWSNQVSSFPPAQFDFQNDSSSSSSSASASKKKSYSSFTLACLGDSNTNTPQEKRWPHFLKHRVFSSSSASQQQNVVINRILNFAIPNTALSRRKDRYCIWKQPNFRSAIISSLIVRNLTDSYHEDVEELNSLNSVVNARDKKTLQQKNSVVSRFDWSKDVDAVSIMFGTNDARERIFHSVADFEKSLTEMIEKLIEQFSTNTENSNNNAANEEEPEDEKDKKNESKKKRRKNKLILLLTPPPMRHGLATVKYRVIKQKYKEVIIPTIRHVAEKFTHKLSSSSSSSSKNSISLLLVDVFRELSRKPYQASYERSRRSSSGDETTSSPLLPDYLKDDFIHTSEFGASVIANLVLAELAAHGF